MDTGKYLVLHSAYEVVCTDSTGTCSSWKNESCHAMPACLPACLPACVSLDLLLDGGTCPGSRLHTFQHKYTASMAGSTPVHSLQ